MTMDQNALRNGVAQHKAGFGMLLVGALAAAFFARKRLTSRPDSP
ncbi:MAG: hypothetical protein ACT4P1_13240 [Sporichthyaceae bacterium]